MKKLKKIMLNLSVLALMIPLLFGVTACWNNENELDDGGNATAESPIIGTWIINDNTYKITQITISLTQITIKFSDPGNRADRTVSSTGSRNSSLKLDNTSFSASKNDPNAQINPSVWDLSGSLVNDVLTITGTITLVEGYVSSQVTVNLTGVLA